MHSVRHFSCIVASVLIFSCFVPLAVSAEQAASPPAPEKPTPPKAPVNVPVPPQAAPSIPVSSVQIPQPFEIKLTGIPGGSGWLGSLVIAALVTAAVSLYSLKRTAEQRDHLESKIKRMEFEHAKEMRKQAEQHEKNMALEQRLFEKSLRESDLEAKTTSDLESGSREDKKIQIEITRLMQQTGANEFEAAIAATRFARESEAELAKLIDLYFDKILSPDLMQRELALFAISSFVDVGELRKSIEQKFVANKESEKTVSEKDPDQSDW